MNIRPFNQQLPQIHESVYVDSSSVLVGEIEIDRDASVWPLVAARGDVNHIRIGARTNIQDGSILHVTRKSESLEDGFPLIIGEDVTVGHKCMLHGCSIGNRVLVGMGAIVLDGAVIEDDVFVGAGALVPPNKRLESGYLYVGNPVVQKRKLSDKEIQFLKLSALHYVKLKDMYIAEQD